MSYSETSKSVREFVLSHPVIKEALLLGIANHSALARMIERKTKCGSQSAIKMALLRLSEDLSEKREIVEESARKVLGSTVLEMRSDLCVATVKKSAMAVVLPSVLKRMEISRFFQLTQGISTFTLVFPEEDRGEVLKLFAGNIVEIIGGQSAVVLVSPEEILSTPGVVECITSELAFENINITQIISCHKDTILVLDRKDAKRAYEVIESFIERMRF